MTDSDALTAAIESHGEVHATVEEYDRELELRQGTTDIDADAGLVRLDNGQTTLCVDIERIVSWYKPVGFFHE